jgi:hypothetical protein
MKFDILGFFEVLSIKFKFDENLAKIAGTLDDDLCIFMITSREILLSMKNIRDRISEKIKTYFYSITFFRENRVAYEIM